MLLDHIECPHACTGEHEPCDDEADGDPSVYPVERPGKQRDHRKHDQDKSALCDAVPHQLLCLAHVPTILCGVLAKRLRHHFLKDTRRADIDRSRERFWHRDAYRRSSG